MFNTFAVPSSYSMIQVGPGGHNENYIWLNGTNVLRGSNNSNWNSRALATWQSRNLNYYFESNANGVSFCGNFNFYTGGNSQKQRLTYTPAIRSNAGGVLAVIERGGNNCLYVEAFGTLAGGSTVVSLGKTFVRTSGDLTGNTQVSPALGSDYWQSGRRFNNGQAIAIGLFNLENIAPTGSSINYIEFSGASSDHGDGKFFIMQKYAVADNDTIVINTTHNGNVGANDNVPNGSVFTLTNPITPASGTLSFNSDGTYTYEPAPNTSGVFTFSYKVCLPSPNSTVCDIATETLYIFPISGPDLTGCTGDTITMDAVGVGGEWSIVPGNPSTTTITDITDKNTTITGFFSTGTYKYLWTAGSLSDTINVVISGNTPVINGQDSVCIGSTVNLTPNSGGVWSSSNNAIASITNAGVVTGQGAGTVTLTFENTNGCSTSITNFKVNPLPNVSLTLVNDQACLNETNVVLSGGSPAGGIYSGTGVSGTNFNAAVAGVGNHTITYSYTDGNACSNSTTDIITVEARPNLSITNAADCALNLQTYSYSINTSSTQSFTSAQGTISGTAPNFTISGVPAGTNDTLVLQNTFCTQQFIINSPNCICPTVASPTSGGNQNICISEGSWPSISASPSFASVVDWYATATGGTLLSTGNTYTPTGALTTGQKCFYAESRRIISSCVSGIRTQVCINVDVLPVINAGNDTAVCSTSFQTNASGSGTWTQVDTHPLVGITGSTNPNQSLNLTAGLTYSFEWCGTNGTCTVCDTVSVQVYNVPPAPISVEGNQDLCISDLPATLNVTTNAANTVSWYSDAALNNLVASGLFYSTSTAGTYYAVATNSNGCISSATSVELTIDQLPTNVNAGADFSLCANENTFVNANLSATGNGGTGTWMQFQVLELMD